MLCGWGGNCRPGGKQWQPTAGWMTYTVTCRLTACTPGSAPGPTLVIEYGKPLPLPFRHSLKVRTGWRNMSCKIRPITLSLGLSRCLACTANAGCTVRISSADNSITILTNFGGYKTFRPLLTKYCVPGMSAVALTPTVPTRHNPSARTKWDWTSKRGSELLVYTEKPWLYVQLHAIIACNLLHAICMQ